MGLFSKCRIPSAHRMNRMIPYSTPRLAKIADWRLGILNIILQAIIVCILVWKLVGGLGWVKIGSTQGEVKASVYVAQDTYLKKIEEYPYCLTDANFEKCRAGNKLDLSKTGCTKTTTLSPAKDTDSYNSFISKCIYSSTLMISYPRGEMNQIFITTRRTEEVYKQKEVLGVLGGPKSWYEDYEGMHKDEHELTNSYFVAGVEFATIRILHNMNVATDNFFGTETVYTEKSSREIVGFLVGSDGKYIDPCEFYTKNGKECPSFISAGCRSRVYNGDQSELAPFEGKPNNCEDEDARGKTSCSCQAKDEATHISAKKRNDIVALGTLLEMAGIDLDKESLSSEGESARYSGIVLVVTIEYTNTHIEGSLIDFTLNTYRYLITATRMSAMEFKLLQEYEKANPKSDTKYVYNRHGIRIIFVSTGRVGQGNLDSTVAAIVAALASAALVGVLINFIAFNLMNEWKYGGQGKIVEAITGHLTLKVEVIEAINIPEDRDFNDGDDESAHANNCDPYVELKCNFQRQITRVKYQTRNPKWAIGDNIFEFIYDTPGMPNQDLDIAVLDVQTGTTTANDTVLAHSSIDLSKLKNDKDEHLKVGGTLEDMDVWVDLHVGGLHEARMKQVQCKIHLRISVEIASKVTKKTACQNLLGCLKSEDKTDKTDKTHPQTITPVVAKEQDCKISFSLEHKEGEIDKKEDSKDK